MTDEELIGYADIHSRTERALFASEHINRILELAGSKQRVEEGGFFSWHKPDITQYLEEARKRLQKP